MPVDGLLDFVFIFYFFVAQACMLLSRFAKNMFNLQLGASILGALCVSILVPSCASPSCTTMHWLSLCQTWSVPQGGSQATGLYFFFCWPRWNNFQDIEGRYHVRPSPWYLSSLRWMSHNFYAEIGVFVILCQNRAFLNFAFIFFFGGSSLGTFHKVFKEQIQSSICCFHFGGTVRFCSVLVPICAFISLLLCIGWVCSVPQGGSQATVV